MSREHVFAALLALASLSISTFVFYDDLTKSSDALTQEREIPRADAAVELRRGINILGYDGIWEGGVDAPFHMSDFDRIRAAGFDHVRVNFFGLRFMDARGRIDAQVLSRLDHVLGEAVARGLSVVLDQHDNADCQLAKPNCKPQLVDFWRQIAFRYRGAYPHIVFELLNEPGGQMTHEHWNDTLAATLAAVREIDPQRRVVVAALNGEDARDIEKLSLPASDRNVIVTVHYYAPMRFTHQGAPWSPAFAKLRDVDWGAPDEKRKVVDDFGVVARWAKANGRQVYLGEFGVYDAAPMKARAAWLSYVSRAAERLGWGWAVWQFDHDFSLYDQRALSWRRPVLDAVIGKQISR